MSQEPETLAGMLLAANQIEETLAANGGEITPELEVLMQLNSEALPAKIDGIVFTMKRLEATEKMFAEEAQRYTRVARGLSNAYDKIKAYVKDGMIANGITEIQGRSNKFALTNSVSKLVIENLDLLDDKYKITETTVKANREAILADLSHSKTVVGAHVEPVKALRVYASKGTK